MGELITVSHVRLIVAGDISGIALATEEPLSFWGGLNPDTGEIIDRRHPLSGEIVSGKVLVLPQGRGSCSASGVLLEAIRNGKAPLAIIISHLDPVVCLGAVLADELYGQVSPVAVVSDELRRSVQTGDHITLTRNGDLTIRSAGGTR